MSKPALPWELIFDGLAAALEVWQERSALKASEPEAEPPSEPTPKARASEFTPWIPPNPQIEHALKAIASLGDRVKALEAQLADLRRAVQMIESSVPNFTFVQDRILALENASKKDT